MSINMRFVSFNINGLRAHIHQLDAILNELKPDILGLQETKVHDSEFPVKLLKKYGYHIYYYGQKKYQGVALFLRQAPIAVYYGLNNNELLSKERRVIRAKINTSAGLLNIVNCYCPQGEDKYSHKFILKQLFYQKMQLFVKNIYNNQSLLLIMGDMNISPTDFDIGIGEINKKKWLKLGRCSFLAEERQWMHHLMNQGLVDIYRSKHPQNNTYYSWFSYISNGFKNNKGLRIDLILVDQKLALYCQRSEINYTIRNMQRPSDHAPVWADFNI